jgi:hypothetical protein
MCTAMEPGIDLSRLLPAAPTSQKGTMPEFLFLKSLLVSAAAATVAPVINGLEASGLAIQRSIDQAGNSIAVSLHDKWGHIQ